MLGRSSTNRMRRFLSVLMLSLRLDCALILAPSMCTSVLHPGVLLAERFTGVSDSALAQQLSSSIGPYRFTEMEALCLRHGVGGSQEIALLLGLHALGNDDDPDIAR